MVGKTANSVDINVARLISEPVLASIAYDIELIDEEIEKHILVFDLGGSSLDVSLLSCEERVFENLATRHVDLGGNDFNRRVLEHFKDVLHRTADLTDIKDSAAMKKLESQAEEAKKALSTKSSFGLKLRVEGVSVRETLTRPKFEQLSEEIFGQLIEPIKQVLEEAKVETGDIHHLLLVGGSSKIPKVRELVESFIGLAAARCCQGSQTKVRMGRC